MLANEADIRNAAQILANWNPLGDRASEVEDLNGYRTEAEDILFHIHLDLSLTLEDYREPAARIVAIAARR